MIATPSRLPRVPMRGAMAAIELAASGLAHRVFLFMPASSIIRIDEWRF
jgi:hypothetical protein